MGYSLDKINDPALRAKLAASLVDTHISPKPTLKPGKRMRQKSGDGMNGWEREWLMLLRARPGHRTDHREASLPLANGLRYKLDFLTSRDDIDPADPYVIEGFEVKGFARSTGIAKLKMAATLYPWIKFYLVYKRDGAWQTEDVKP